ncbi:MAG: uncharacterized protein QOG37_1853 [Mycobacterium sp.]|nr:uncharacterized protein [Mycobacterium sp.]
MVPIEDAQTTVGRFVTALAEERSDDARMLLHDDFVGYEAGGLPYSGEYHGPQGFFELMAKMNDGLDVTLGPFASEFARHDTGGSTDTKDSITPIRCVVSLTCALASDDTCDIAFEN